MLEGRRVETITLLVIAESYLHILFKEEFVGNLIIFDMEVAIIILACFIILLAVVIYKLGRKLKAKDNQIKAIKAEIERQKFLSENPVEIWLLDVLFTFINEQE